MTYFKNRKAGLLVALLALIAPAASLAAGSFESLVGKSGVYTLVNLHPDERRAKLYAVNYQQAGLIPLCSKVKILKVSWKKMKFVVEKTGKEYTYNYHKAAGEDFQNHLARFFGTSCNSSKVKKMSKLDQKGIRKGQALEGMTRQGVIYAMGPPPRQATPDPDSPRWLYWQSRWNKIAIEFNEAGKVDAIVD